MNINKINNLSLPLQLLLAAILPVLFIALFIFLVYLPKNEELDNLNTQLIKLDKEIAISETMIRKLDALIAENEALQKKLAKLKEQLPEEKEVSMLLRQISDLGLQAGLEIKLWQPQTKRTDPGGLFVEIPVKVEVLAEYHRLGDFYSQISRLPRLVNISDIDLMVIDKSGVVNRGVINAKFTARTFASVSPKEAAAVAAQQIKK